jgi:hypothetical protein
MEFLTLLTGKHSAIEREDGGEHRNRKKFTEQFFDKFEFLIKGSGFDSRNNFNINGNSRSITLLRCERF